MLFLSPVRYSVNFNEYSFISLTMKMSRSATESFVLLLLCVSVVVIENCDEEDVRLVTRNEKVLLKVYKKTTNARVEVCKDNEWSTICDDYFNIHAARHFCQTLELPYDYVGVIEEYGGGSGSIYHFRCLDENNCAYSEAECSHTEDAGIRCYKDPECEDGQTRLITDRVDNVGLVELCVSGLWRSVCLEGWDYRETDIFCRQLNFSGWSFPVSAHEMNVEFHDYVTISCRGNESKLGECEYEFVGVCPYWGPAGAYCNNKECVHGATVLVGGRDPYYGRVEYCYEGQWYTLCADDWDDTGEETRVVCQSAGYAKGSITDSAVIDYYGKGENPILPIEIQCKRTDWEPNECFTSAIDVSQCSQVAGVVCDATCNSEACIQCDSDCEIERSCSCSLGCFAGGECCEDVSILSCIERECDSGAVRLVGGENDTVGALEVCVSGIWGRVCQYPGVWSYKNAQIICRQLQYSVEGAELLKSSSLVSKSSRNFILDRVYCVGTESEILQCQHSSIGLHTCDDTADTPVISCKERESDCENGEVRLVDGEKPTSGHVEICQDGLWGRACIKGWKINDIKVICRQLNYELVGLDELNCSGNDLVLLGETHCLGTEHSFTECRRDRRLPDDCQCVNIVCQNSDGKMLWSVMAIVPTLGVITVLAIIFICLYVRIKKKRALLKMQQDMMAMPMKNILPLGRCDLRRERIPVGEHESQPLRDSHQLIQESKCSTQTVYNQAEVFYCNKYDNIGDLLLDRDEVIIMEPIGKGVFGAVYKGRLKSCRKIIAVKTINGDFDQLELDTLVEEASKMNTFDHVHVMSIIGICLDTDSAPYLVMPFMENGSLLDYLQREKKTLIPSDDTVPEEVEEISRRLLEMCRQIASGMEYLASLKYVHRDLAARNCMIDGQFVIKVSDFGLLEDVFEKNYLRLNKSEDRGLCVKWMSLESLAKGFFSEKSDVWSYGVTMWEIFSGGETPSYSDDTSLGLLRSLQDGNRLPQPDNPACSGESVQVMKQCWEEEAEDRPSFEALHSIISGFLERMSNYLQLESNPFANNTAGTYD